MAESNKDKDIEEIRKKKLEKMKKKDTGSDGLEKLTDENFNKKTSEGKWIVDCWASWCGPCKQYSPIVEQASKEVDAVNFGKLNVDKNKKTAQLFGIRSIPTTLYIKDGEAVDQSLGALPKEKLKNKIDSVFGSE